MRKNEQEEVYYKNNFKNSSSVYPIVPEKEIRWLQEELNDGMKYIVFSHHSLVNDFVRRGVNNREDIRKLFVGKSVVLCANGHDHGDNYSLEDGISYLSVTPDDIGVYDYKWNGVSIKPQISSHLIKL